jgi:hypothetical protein
MINTPDGRLDSTHTWQSETDRESYMRAFQTGSAEDKRMAVALMCADPATPENVIRRQLTNVFIPPRLGYDRTEPDIDVVLAQEPEVFPHSFMDFSNDPAGRDSSSRGMEAGK